MNKIDKFLYGGFAVVLVGFVAMMLVSVFSPLKQSSEEIVETQQSEQATMQTASTVKAPAQRKNNYVASYLDGAGNKVYLTQEELDEMRAFTKEIKRTEAEKKAKEAERIAKEKAWWESRQDWIDRFPFEPTYHPEITFDPTDEKMRDKVRNHSFLRMFHNSRLRYTEEFEQLYDIVKEVVGEEKADNPIILGNTFSTLKEYHQAKAQDPETIYRKNAKVALPRQPPKVQKPIVETLTPEQYMAYRALPERERRAMTAELRASRQKEMRAQLRAYHAAPKYQTVDITWGEEAESLKRCIIGALCKKIQPDQPWMTDEQALAIRERLLDEIPAAGFIEMGNAVFASVQRYERELKPGDPLLIK